MHGALATPSVANADDPPPPVDSRSATTQRRWVLVPVVVSLVLVLLSVGRLDRPFGPSYDGFNTAVWATGAQTVRSHGWLEARLGGVGERGDTITPYAHHPAMTQLVASAAGTTLGDERWAYRLSALLFTIGAVWTCWGWLGACAFRPAARSVGVLVAAGSPLVLDYGVMLNMELIWLPLLFGLLWAWRVAERSPLSRWVGPNCGVVAVLGGLAAHHGILLAGALGAIGLIRAKLSRRSPYPHELWTLGGGALSGVLFLAWAGWVNGGLDALWRSAGIRVGAPGWMEWAGTQAEHLTLLFGLLGTAVLIGGAWLIRERRDLWVGVGAALAVTITYAVVFRDGASHPYWNAGLLAPVALGGALVWQWARSTSRPLSVILLVACAIPFITSARPDTPETSDHHVAAVVAAGRAQQTVYGTFFLGDWAIYESGRAVESLTTCPAVRIVAADDPDALIVTSGRWVQGNTGRPGWPLLSEVATARHGDVALVGAVDLADLAC